MIGNTQVSWWSVHQHVAPLLDQVGEWPMAGTPEWCSLPAGDPRKLAALYDAAQHHSLRVETCQQARAEASHDISAAEDWYSIGAEIYRRSGGYIRREVVA